MNPITLTSIMNIKIAEKPKIIILSNNPLKKLLNNKKILLMLRKDK